MNKGRDRKEVFWEKGWDGHKKEQLLRMSKLPFKEKIWWMKEAQEVIQNLQRPKARDDEESNKASEC